MENQNFKPTLYQAKLDNGVDDPITFYFLSRKDAETMRVFNNKTSNELGIKPMFKLSLRMKSPKLIYHHVN